jgi:hypothetical protein
MWKWLSCKLWGASCKWHTLKTERYQRECYGVYVNTTPPRMLCERHTQRCETCGELRSREVQLGPV